MKLNLTKPLCVLDLETTGISIAKDKIVEISILKVFPDGNSETKTLLVNPQIPIPEDVTKIHNISDETIKDSPVFSEIANDINQFIKGCDLAGFNSNKFDIPLLAEEMLRSGIEFDLKNTKTIDVQTIFHKMEKRTLEAAYKFYCNETLKNAHSAKADVEATFKVLEAQVGRYNEIENNIDFLAEFSIQNRFADLAGFIRFNAENKEVFSFGKHKNQLVEDVLKKDKNYFNWIQNADFPLYTKKTLTKIKLRNFNL